jgi:hypothetical protein
MPSHLDGGRVRLSLTGANLMRLGPDRRLGRDPAIVEYLELSDREPSAISLLL